MSRLGEYYPTPEHAEAARAIVERYAAVPEVEAVLLVNSCAREGRASPGSCLDVVMFVPGITGWEAIDRWENDFRAFEVTQDVFARMKAHGPFAHVDPGFFNGRFEEPYHGWTSGADAFELEIGNTLAYSVPLFERGDSFQQLKAQWLPYYSGAVRKRRLAMVRGYCINNLDHIPLFVPRGLYFQAFDRLYNAFKEFLQALFIARRTYPIAYDKWIKEQVVEILGLPELYPQLVSLLEVHHLESDELVGKAATLRALVEQYAVE